MYRLLPICSTLTKTVTVLVIFYRTLTNAEFYKDYKRIKRKKMFRKRCHYILPVLCQIQTDFKNSFADRLSSKFVVK